MEGAEGQNLLRQIQNLVEWHPRRNDLYYFVHDHRMDFFHEKPKKEKSDVEDDGGSSCFGCSLPIEDHHPSYGCTRCQKFLHKACAELPREIKHPAHALHSLILLQGLNPHVPSASSKGKLCLGCEIPIQSVAYGCAGCGVFFHKTCLGFPDIMLHPNHSTHRLKLNYEYLGGNPPKTFHCRCCKQDHTGFNYSCESCDFTLGIRCIFPSSATTKAGSADEIEAGHLLVLLDKQPDGLREDDCLACGEPIVNSEQQPIFQCKDCKFSLHHGCVLQQIFSMLPSYFECSQHEHKLRLTTVREGRWIYCDICDGYEPEMGSSIPSYYCEECDFDAHVICMLRQMDFSLAHRLDSVVLNISPVVVRKLSLTVGDIVKSMKEDEKQSLFDIVKTATSGTREKPKDPEYSDELFSRTMNNFGAKCLGHRSRLKCDAMKSPITKIGSNLVPKALAPVFEVLNTKYLDTLVAEPKSKGIRIFVFMVLCAAIDSICSTKESNLNEAQLYMCWESFKIVQIAGFRADFAFERLRKALNSYFGLQDMSSSDGSFSALDSDMENTNNDMEAHLEKCMQQVTSLSRYHPEIGERIEIVGKIYNRDSWYDYFHIYLDQPISTDDEESPDAIEEASICREEESPDAIEEASICREEERPDAIEEASICGEEEQRANTTEVGADSKNNRHAHISKKIKEFIEERFLSNRSVLDLPEDEKKKIRDYNFHNHKLTCPQSQTSKNKDKSRTHPERLVTCFACDLPISKPTNYCSQCKSYFHNFCVHLGRVIVDHPLHGNGHCLVLDHKPGNPEKAKCNACGENCRGIYYRCQACNFNLEVQCLFRKPTEETISHGMAVLMDDSTTTNKSQGCFACRKKIRGPPFLRCAACNVSLHMGCADEKIDNLPLKETWGAKRITSE